MILDPYYVLYKLYQYLFLFTGNRVGYKPINNKMCKKEATSEAYGQGMLAALTLLDEEKTNLSYLEILVSLQGEHYYWWRSEESANIKDFDVFFSVMTAIKSIFKHCAEEKYEQYVNSGELQLPSAWGTFIFLVNFIKVVKASVCKFHERKNKEQFASICEAAHAFNILQFKHYSFLICRTNIFNPMPYFENLSSSLLEYVNYNHSINGPSIPMLKDLEQKVSDEGRQGSVLSEHNECVVCLEVLDESSDLAVFDCCDHVVCTSCALHWLVRPHPSFHPKMFTGGKNSSECPLCRQRVNQWTTSTLAEKYRKVPQVQ